MRVDFNTLPDQAKVWLYQSKKPLQEAEITMIRNSSGVFLSNWESHGIPVEGAIDVVKDHFIRIAAFTDEPSMCGRAQDAQVNFVKDIELKLNLVLTDRLELAFVIGNVVKIVQMSAVETKISEGTIMPETVFFNNLVSSKREFRNSWSVPASKSWLSQYF